MWGLDLWAGAPSCLGIPGQREGASLRAGALRSSLHLVTPRCVSLASHCPTVGPSLSVCEVEEALNCIICRISFSFCDSNPTRPTLLTFTESRWAQLSSLPRTVP